MIGFVRGKLVIKTPPHLTVDVGGVGYDIEAPMSTFYTLPAVGSDVRLLTHLVVREDAHILYGFGTQEERALFRNLLKVSGVGPKIALAILSGVSVEGFATLREAAGRRVADADSRRGPQDRRAPADRNARSAGCARAAGAAGAPLPSGADAAPKARPGARWWRSATSPRK